MKLHVLCCALVAAGLIGCEACGGQAAQRSGTQQAASSPDSGRYRSDYFVFVSETASPLRIVSIDVNWRRTDDGGLSMELKGWLGGSTGWPMRYETRKVGIRGDVPDTWFRVPTPSGFRFVDKGHRIEVEVDGHDVKLDVPGTFGESATRETFAGGTIVTQVVGTELQVDEKTLGGRVLHEQVRLPAGADVSFGRFQYFVIQGCDGFYVIKDHGARGRHASRFHPKRDHVQETSDFHFSERAHASDEQAKRDDLPTAWRVRISEWSQTLEFQTVAGHTGYGPTKADPRPIYRQAAVRGRDSQDCDVHGMAELVLEE